LDLLATVNGIANIMVSFSGKSTKSFPILSKTELVVWIGQICQFSNHDREVTLRPAPVTERGLPCGSYQRQPHHKPRGKPYAETA
jgi:hypothetical protein